MGEACSFRFRVIDFALLRGGIGKVRLEKSRLEYRNSNRSMEDIWIRQRIIWNIQKNRYRF